MTTPPVALTVSVDSTGPAPTFPDGTLPATGAGTFSRGTAAAGALALALGALAVGVARRRPVVR
jgi:LPXTG-motif cell wall-anchored protein